MQDHEELGATRHAPLQRGLHAAAVAQVARVAQSKGAGPREKCFDLLPGAVSARVVDQQQTIVQARGQPLPGDAVQRGGKEGLSVVTRDVQNAGSHLLVLLPAECEYASSGNTEVLRTVPTSAPPGDRAPRVRRWLRINRAVARTPTPAGRGRKPRGNRGGPRPGHRSGWGNPDTRSAPLRRCRGQYSSPRRHQC